MQKEKTFFFFPSGFGGVPTLLDAFFIFLYVDVDLHHHEAIDHEHFALEGLFASFLWPDVDCTAKLQTKKPDIKKFDVG